MWYDWGPYERRGAESQGATVRVLCLQAKNRPGGQQTATTSRDGAWSGLSPRRNRPCPHHGLGSWGVSDCCPKP